MTEHPPSFLPNNASVRPMLTRDFLSLLKDMAAMASQATDRGALLQMALDTVRALLPVDDIGIYLFDPDSELWELTTPSVYDHGVLCQQTGNILIQQPETLVIDDLAVRDHPLSLYAGPYRRAVAAVPLLSNNRLIGMICAVHGQPYAFNTDEIAALELVAYQAGMGLHRLVQTAIQAIDSFSLNVLLENTGDAVLITDANGCIAEINPAARAMFAFSPDEIRCQPLRELAFPAELRDALDTMLQRPTGSQMTFNTRLTDGRELAVSLASADPQAHTETSYDTGRLVMIARDMTRLRDAERARLNFIHSAAHDLRNPLSVTLGALSMLNKELRNTGSEIQHEIIAIGLHGIERIEKLINGLLHLEHIENESGLSQTLVDVHDLVERAIIDTRPLIASRNHSFILDIPDELPALTGDIHWLTRALVQILTNAAQFTPPGGEITLRVTAHPRAIYIEVEDTGPGIPPKDQASIFDPFVHGSQTDAEGAGLGLAIVKAVVERHQGRVFVKSEPDLGSVFGVILPISSTTT